ncbi:MAG: inner membrane protein [Acidobacteriota bacterium]|nr:inner membrane protein [Acidobacteriota bacterium]
MDNLAHTLVGLAAAKAGLERASPYATAVCVVAANAPDADILATYRGRWFYLENHRGITHSIVGTLALAVLIPLIFYAIEKLIARLRGKPQRIRLGGLMLASLLASATHPLMDWTNNYGVRPFLPWSGKWYYGDLVFIVDPWLWLVVGGAVFLATARNGLRTAAWTALAVVITLVILFVRADVPVASRALWLAGVVGFATAHHFKVAARFGRAIPALALAFVPAYWCALAVVHARAVRAGEMVMRDLAGANGEATKRLAAMPSLANPARWRVVGETDRADYVLQMNLATSAGVSATTQTAARYEKLSGTDAERLNQLARADERARIFLNFARFPLARIVQSPDGESRAQLFDLRFNEPSASAPRGAFAVELPLGKQP